MRKKNKKLYVILIVIVIFGISVGYAAINRALTITGNSKVKQNTWNIHFKNIKIKNGSVYAALPVIDSSYTTINFSFSLNLPGDFYEFTVDVVNSGTIDAMIDSITKNPELTTEQAKYLNYIIEYQNGDQITAKQLVEKESFVRIKVRVEYRKDITEFDLPVTTESLNLGFTINYVQADNTGISVKYNGLIKPITNGDINDIGTIVTIGSERFYTIGTEGDNVKLFAMYNLHVGGECTGTVNNLCTFYGNKATGMQDENMKGVMPNYTIIKGTTPFSTSYEKGENYSTYEGSRVEKYVNNYKDILLEYFDINVIKARLITVDELTDNETFACSIEQKSCSNSPYSWIYSTSYWTETAENTNTIWCVRTGQNLLDAFAYGYDYYFGVRPVIVIPINDIVIN